MVSAALIPRIAAAADASLAAILARSMFGIAIAAIVPHKRKEHRIAPMLPTCTLLKQLYLLQRGYGVRTSSGQGADLGANHRILKRAERADAGLASSRRICAELVTSVDSTTSCCRGVCISVAALDAESQHVVNQTGVSVRWRTGGA